MLTPTAAANWKFRGPPPSDDGNSAITEYYIQWDEKDNSSPRTWSVLTLGGGPNANTYQITGLTNGTEYLVRVNAINVNGDGVISETSGTPWEPPEPPAPVLKTVSQFVIHSTHIVIKWEPAIKGPGTFVQWHQRRRHTSASATWNTTDAGYFPGTVSPGAIDETGTQMPISGLTSGQAYDFQIAMETSEGMGPWSNKRTVTPIPPLTVPQDIEVVERNGEILVKIKDYDRSDANTSGYPDKYEFQFRPCVYLSPDPDPCTPTAAWGLHGNYVTNQNVYQYTFEGLTNDIRHEFRVRAIRSTEKTAYSATFNGTPDSSLAIPSDAFRPTSTSDSGTQPTSESMTSAGTSTSTSRARSVNTILQVDGATSNGTAAP